MEPDTNMDDINKLNFELLIRQELENLLSLLEVQVKQDEKIYIKSSELAQIVHILGYYHFYQFSSSRPDPYIRFYFEKIGELLRKTTRRNIVDFIGTFLISGEGPHPLNRTNYEIEKMLSGAAAEQAGIIEIKKIFPDSTEITDQGKMILVYFLDCYQDLSFKKTFNNLKILLLNGIHRKSECLYSKYGNLTDLEQFSPSLKQGKMPLSSISPFRRTLIQRSFKQIRDTAKDVLKNMVLLEKAPLILGVVFLAIGYSLSFVFSEYKDRHILQYNYTIRGITKDSLLLDGYKQLITGYWTQYHTLIDKQRPDTCSIDSILKFRSIPIKTKKFYVHTLQFKNISVHQNLSNFDLIFQPYKTGAAVLYCSPTFSGIIYAKSNSEKEHVANPVICKVPVVVLLPDNILNITIITNDDSNLSLVISGAYNITLMQDSVFSTMIDYWVNTIFWFLLFACMVVVFYFVAYSKLKK
jgi:hypothetical protein